MPVQIPNLPTLDVPPSWLNAAGHIDRSACIELRVGELRRRLLGCVRNLRGKGAGVRKGKSNKLIAPLPNEKPARNGRGRICTGACIIDRDELEFLQHHRLPRELAGDSRTARAPAMRPFSLEPAGRRAPRFNIRAKRNTPFITFITAKLDGNPNKGASRTKRLCLPTDWRHALRIEKWLAGKRRLPEYFLICPGFHHGDHGEERKLKPRIDTDTWDQEGIGSQQRKTSASSVSSVVNLPPLSTRRPGREHPSSRKCPQRVRKLLMPLCTQQEQVDAIVAQTWIESLPPGMERVHFQLINRLVHRYGILFHPRRLLCQRCLNVHYGNDPEKNRQQYRRSVGKPPPTAEQIIQGMEEPPTHWTLYKRKLAEMRNSPRRNFRGRRTQTKTKRRQATEKQPRGVNPRDHQPRTPAPGMKAPAPGMKASAPGSLNHEQPTTNHRPRNHEQKSTNHRTRKVTSNPVPLVKHESRTIAPPPARSLPRASDGLAFLNQMHKVFKREREAERLFALARQLETKVNAWLERRKGEAAK